MGSFVSRFLKSWFGDFSKEELKKFIFLALIFAFTIGIYWFLRTNKDGVFNTIVGINFQPFAKWLSMFVVIPLTMFYGFLVNKFPKHRVFYALSVLYGGGSLIFAYFLASESMGISNHVSSPWRLLGWAYYLFVESFGSIMVVLFWTFASDTTSPESAKKGFPLLAFIAQFGAFAGSAVNSGRFGTFNLSSSLISCSVAIIMIAVLIYIFMMVIPQDQLKSYGGASAEKKEKKKVGFMEGFKLVFSQPYLLGIFSSIMIYEIIITLFDFRFKVLIAEDITNLISLNNIETALQGVYKTTKMNEWVGFMGEWQSILGISSYMFGLSQFARWIGLSKSLMILPILLGIVAVFVGGSKSVFVAAVAMIIAKGLNYAFYQPIKEQLSIPTSKEAKYKSKAFIDMFGSRSSKAIGSLVNMIKEWAPYAFPIISLASSLGLILIWLLIALYLGKTFNKAVAKNEVVC